MKYFITSNLLLISILVIGFCNMANAQLCSGTWALQRPLTSQCVTGQWVGWQNVTEPVGCPTNPTYTGSQTNTFTFTIPVNNFSIDFIGFDGSPFCARIEVKVNGVLYHLTNANLVDIPAGAHCATLGSFTNVTLTPDGYITTSATGGPAISGWGRIHINHVNVTSVSVSTNDAAGTLFTNPFNCTDVIPLTLEHFSGFANNCKVVLNWKSGLEINVRNIEIQQSIDNTTFTTVTHVNAKGSNSHYSIELPHLNDAFYRLKINDFDNTYQYSHIIHVKKRCSNTDYQIHPNPTRNSIQVSNLRAGDRVVIADVQGRKVLTVPAYQLNGKIDVTALPSGIYVLRVIHEGKMVESLKLIKR